MLFPRDNAEGQCVFIDWQSWRVGLGTSDLAYMIAVYWYPERRQRLEQPLLKLYVKEIQKYGVDYSWEDLWIDYRVAVIESLLTPVFFHALQIHPSGWWDHIERAFAAFEDLNCSELL